MPFLSWSLSLLCLCFCLSCVDLVSVSGQQSGWVNPDYSSLRGVPFNVSFDHRSIIINGQRALLFAGSTHYPRSTPDMWSALLHQFRAGGLNTLQAIIFWNYHELLPSHYDFESESRNVLQFLRAAADAGLFVFLRLGPYICAEWQYGGIPFWLRNASDPVVFRSMDPRWLREADRWLGFITTLIEPLLARNGGPVILYQLENEYGLVESAYPDGAEFVQWNANKSIELNLGIPCAMCSQTDVPPFILSTYNGWYGDTWIDGHWSAYPNQPAMWTELWQGWYQPWNDGSTTRPVEDVAFAETRWVSRGGSYTAIYTMFGGTTFHRQTGWPDLITSYPFGAPINPDGQLNSYKFFHLQALHRVLYKYANVIINHAAIDDQVLDGLVIVNAYNSSDTSSNSGVAFLSNCYQGLENNRSIVWNNKEWHLTAWSVKIIDLATNTEVFDTSNVTYAITQYQQYQQHQQQHQQYVQSQHKHNNNHKQHPQRQQQPITQSPVATYWIADIPGIWNPEQAMVSDHVLEQLDVTQFLSDYLWYSTAITLTQRQIDRGVVPFNISHANEYTYYYLDSVCLARTDHVSDAVIIDLSVSGFSAGKHTFQFLNSLNGVDNFGAHLELIEKGLRGVLVLDGQDLSHQTWTHQVGLYGEAQRWYTLAGEAKAQWRNDIDKSINATLVWYQWIISTPNTAILPNTSYFVDVRGLGKGLMYVNGQCIGRFNHIILPPSACTPCDPHSVYNNNKCKVGCGQLAQPTLFVPASFLAAPGMNNSFIAFSEYGSDPRTFVLTTQSS